LNGGILDMAVSPEEVRHVAWLARLRLTAHEERLFSEQLSNILAHVAKLQELDVEGIEPTFHVLKTLSNVYRPDEVRSWPELREVVQAAPQQRDGLFAVPRVLPEGEDEVSAKNEKDG